MPPEEEPAQGGAGGRPGETVGGVTDDARRFEFMAAEKRTRIEAMKDAPSLS